ncbi:MAG TPA: SCO6880 family protein, partial [Acidimicrobiales bacterium]|nr:SCO6880 family protein [Acidimicrobiales bacterium]
MTTYADYQRDRIGWFFGLSGGQLMFLSLASLPAFWAISRGAWFSALLFAMVWPFVLAITIIPVRGRSATGWVFASTMYAVGGLLDWTSFRAKATEGRAEDLDTPDLPGVLQGIKIHDGPPHGSQLQRVGVIHDDATKTWAVTASIVHPGIGMKDTEERSRYGEALAGLLDVAGRTE